MYKSKTKTKTKTLILFTNSFPFDIGEEFIENEIIEAGRCFDKVFIVPNSINGKKRKIPTNAEAITLEELDFTSKRPSIIQFIKLFTKELFLQNSKTLARLKSVKVSWNYYKAQYHKSIAIGELLKSTINDEGSVLLYDFWATNNALAIMLAKKVYPNISYIACAHNYDLYDFRWMCPIPFRGISMLSADMVFPDSKYGVEYLKSKTPSSLHHKIQVAYMGTPDFGLAPIPKDNKIVILSTSRCIPHKRIDWIIQAIANLENKQIEWVHFGNGEMLEDLKTMASELLPKNSFKFYGWVDFDKLIEYYKNTAIDAFIHMSTAEGLPVSLMIASSFGVPIVAVDSMGVKELINDDTGHLLKSDCNIEDATSAIESILQKKSRSEVQRKNVRRYCMQNFSTDNYKEFYNKKLEF